MAIDKAGLLFTIKADSKDAERALNQMTAQLLGLGGDAEKAFSKMGTGATLATAAVAGLALGAAAAATAIFSLTKASAEYGSKIYDASQKTGLSAKIISALGFAAETSGSSLEQITNSIAKFNVLLGQAQLENGKADKTLTAFGITARDTDTALRQALKTLVETTNANKQAAIAATLFKDKTGDVLNTVREFNGDLPGLIARLEKLGITLSAQDAKAADEFGDTLDTLTTQAAATGRQFSTELMPAITSAMAAISRYLADNQRDARAWGITLVDTARGVGIMYEDLKSTMFTQFTALAYLFNQSGAESDHRGALLCKSIRQGE
jgi:hypothetical protein